MNKDEAGGNWKQFKGKVKEQWGKLTDDDMTIIEGKRDQLVGKIQERYGYQKDQAETKRWKPGLFWQEVDRLVSAKIRESAHIEEGINYDKSSKKYQCVIEKYESNERSSVKILCHYLKIHPKTSIIKNYNARGKRCSGYRRKAR